MIALKNVVILGLAWAALGGCAASATPTSSTSQAATSGTWVFEGGGYSFNCGDECGAPNCNCVINRCSGNPVGQACGTVGDSCNVVNGRSSYRVLECEGSESSGGGGSGHTWTRTAATNCTDQCEVSSCGCITNLCSGNPEGQACSTPGSSCNVVNGPNFIELECL